MILASEARVPIANRKLEICRLPVTDVRKLAILAGLFILRLVEWDFRVKDLVQKVDKRRFEFRKYGRCILQIGAVLDKPERKTLVEQVNTIHKPRGELRFVRERIVFTVEQ